MVKDGQRYNGKIMSTLSMSARKGQELSIQAEERTVISAVQLVGLIENKLDDY